MSNENNLEMDDDIDNIYNDNEPNNDDDYVD